MSGHVDVQATTENRLKNPDPMGEHCPNSLLISGKTQKNNNKRNNRIAANNILYRLNFIAILVQKQWYKQAITCVLMDGTVHVQ